MTKIIHAYSSDVVEVASDCLNSGGLVAIPTETVYGLAARADIDQAVARIFTVKGRPIGHPLILHIADLDELSRYTTDVPRTALVMASQCWPGPLTLLLRRSGEVSDLVTGGRDTVAIRVPANETTLRIIERCGHAIAAPSANKFGRVSPTNAQHVMADLGGEIDLVIDDDQCSIGVESTIIDFTRGEPQVLRPGGFPIEDLELVIGESIGAPTGESRASGMLASHYAPHGSVKLVSSLNEARELHENSPSSRILAHSEDLPLYAASLYSQMRQADIDGIDTIIAIIPPQHGLGIAIADRLIKASLA